ncbi:MAG: hypothetical protein LBS90_09200 [Oscillospiraceae bacterium]|jgi:hypothetical protein|nr:hypothetical protein [Oscillospiraceae bacterium]
MGFLNSKNKDKIEWPDGADGTPVRGALLTHAGAGGLEAEITVSMLRSFGIPAATELPGEGVVGKVILGRAGSGIDIYVPETMLGDAQALLLAESVESGDEYK